MEQYFKIAFTGHRPPKLGGYDKNNPVRVAIKAEIQYLVSELVNYEATRDGREVVAITGGALGLDQDAASVCHFRMNLRYMVAAPCLQQDAKWPIPSKDAYHALCQSSDPVLAANLNDTKLHRVGGVLYVHNGPYNYHCMQQRNEWMVDHCDLLVAVFNGSLGGTANCVRYAEDQGKVVTNINPESFKGGAK